MICCSQYPILIQLLSQVCPGSKFNNQIALTQQITYPANISCFPQMKPESLAEGELTRTKGSSNKKWDKAIKGLTKNKIARVEKTDVGLIVTLV